MMNEGVQTRDKRGHSQTFSSPTSSAISMLAPSTVPNSKPPFKQNFMLLVPEASVPAVEICLSISEAGVSSSATVKVGGGIGYLLEFQARHVRDRTIKCGH